MANAVLVLGKSGTGKSTSIKNLAPEATVVLNVLGKRLPFKGSGSMYSGDKKNLIQVDDYAAIIEVIKRISDNAKHITNIIIDDATYVIRKEYFKRAKDPGYNKYTELAQHFQSLVQTVEKAREDLNVFFIMHSEDVTSDNITTGYKVSTIGKLLDSQYNIVEVVPMVLYSDIQYDDKGNASYGFYTHRNRTGSIEIPAKTPEGMFDEDFIPNDLAFVVKKMEEYYA